MSSSSSQWDSFNNAPIPSDLSSSFKLTAPPKTDIWRRSDEDGEGDVFTAPIIYQKLPAKEFKSITVTVFAPWSTQYDQGGLVLVLGDGGKGGKRKWIKAGIEYHDLACVLGVVGTDRYSDWSLSPMHQEYHQKATFKMVREDTTLWVYAMQEGGERMVPMREVKWAFLEGRLEGEVWVGVYVAKPTEEEDDQEKGIEVTFEGLEVQREE